MKRVVELISKRHIFNYFILGSAGVLFAWSGFYYIAIAQWNWYIVPVILFAWFSADFVLGLIHFYLDYVGCPKGIGLKALTMHPNRMSNEYFRLKADTMKHLGFIERIAFDFKVHHIYPKALGRRDFSSLVTESTMTHVLPLLILMRIAIDFYEVPDWIVLYTLVMCLGFFLGQYAHANTHKSKEDISFLVRWLQFLRIFLTIERHSLHHNRFERSFCILNGWADCCIDPIANYLLKSGWLKRVNLDLY